MTSSHLEDRLGRAMGAAPSASAGGAPGEDLAQDAAWQQVRDRIREHSREPAGAGPTSESSRDRTPWITALGWAAAAVALVGGGALLWKLVTGDFSGVDGGLGSAPPDASPALPTALSMWWLLVAAVVGIGIVWIADRSLRTPLVTTGVALVVAGAIVGPALMLPSSRAGEELIADAPTLAGYELASARIDRWPDRHEHIVAVMRYVLSPGTDPLDIEATAERLGMTEPRPSRTGYRQTNRCLRRSAADDRGNPNDDVYCLAEVDGDTLIITAHRFTGVGMLVPRIVTYGLIGFGLVVLLVAASGDWLAEDPFRQGRGFVAGALCLFATAGYLVGLIAYDIARVRLAVDIPPACRPGGGTGIVECRDLVYPELDAHGALASGLRIYWPLHVVADGFAAFLLAMGWLTALSGGMNRRRWLLFVGLTALIFVVGATSQLGFADLIGTMSNIND